MSDLGGTLGARLTPKSGRGVTTVAELERAFRQAGLSPRTFRNAPGDTYPRHEHPRHKILYCVTGSITFHTDEGDTSMSSGDRIDLDPGTPHAATVGDAGVVCTECFAPGPESFAPGSY